MDYDGLELAIQDYCQNNETTFVSHINDFIVSAEDKIFAAVKGPQFHKHTTNGTVTVDGTEEYTLTDTGIIDILSVRLCEEAGGTIDDGTTGPNRYLLRKDQEFLREAYPGTAAGPTKGIPRYYDITDSTNVAASNTVQMSIVFAPIPDAAYTYEVEYLGKDPADSITNGNTPESRTVGTARSTPATTTTWVSAAYPDVLMWGAITHAYQFMKGESDMQAQYQKNFDEALLLFKNMAENRQADDIFSSTPTSDAAGPKGQE